MIYATPIQQSRVHLQIRFGRIGINLPEPNQDWHLGHSDQDLYPFQINLNKIFVRVSTCCPKYWKNKSVWVYDTDEKDKTSIAGSGSGYLGIKTMLIHNSVKKKHFIIKFVHSVIGFVNFCIRSFMHAFTRIYIFDFSYWMCPEWQPHSFIC